MIGIDPWCSTHWLEVWWVDICQARLALMQVAKKHLQDGMLLRESERRQLFRRPKMLICEFVVQLFLIKAGLFSSHAKPKKLVGNPRLPLYTQTEDFSGVCTGKIHLTIPGFGETNGASHRNGRPMDAGIVWVMQLVGWHLGWGLWEDPLGFCGDFCWTRAVAFLYSKLIWITVIVFFLGEIED